MNTLELPPPVTSIKSFALPELDALQLQVARRADVLARGFARGVREHDRRIWLRAEWEIFERSERAEPGVTERVLRPGEFTGAARK
jgi:hypothetical protein